MGWGVHKRREKGKDKNDIHGEIGITSSFPLSFLLWTAVDFGVSAQLDRTIGKRNTFIGTPYW